MVLAKGEIRISREPLVKMDLGSSEEGLVRLSDEEWWRRRSSSEVRAMLIGTNCPRRVEDPGRRDETSIGEQISSAEGRGEKKKIMKVEEQIRVESDASWRLAESYLYGDAL